jgi:hypothetical protein
MDLIASPFGRHRARLGRGRRPLGRRVLAWFYSWQLDEALAAGADPTGDPALACRAATLTSALWTGGSSRDLDEAVRAAVAGLGG